MAEFKHLVVAKFKEGVDVEELLKGMEKLVSEIDDVHSFEWGEDLESHEMLRQGFTYAFMMTFKTKENYNAFTNHPKHIEFSATFADVIDKFVVLDFPATLIKPPQPPPLPPQPIGLEEREATNKIEGEKASEKANGKIEEVFDKTTVHKDGIENSEKTNGDLEDESAK